MNFNPYLINNDLFKVIEKKEILFDTDAIISIINFKAQDLASQLIKSSIALVYIHLCWSELMRTNSERIKLQRQKFIEKYQMEDFPITNKITDSSNNMQSILSNYNTHPSPTDLYLAGTLHQNPHTMLLLTGNISNFPYPIFERVCNIILQNNKQFKVLTLLKISNKAMQDLSVIQEEYVKPLIPNHNFQLNP